MMGVPPDVTARLTIWEFTAMRSVWNARHKADSDDGDDEPIEPPDPEFVRQRHAAIKAKYAGGTE